MNAVGLVRAIRTTELARVLVVGLVGVGWLALATVVAGQSNDRWNDVPRILVAGSKTDATGIRKIRQSDTQWRRQLSELEYEVTRQKGTERPYSGKYWASKADGIYVCKCCSAPLFDSRHKFESGTGWPSYYQPVSAESVLSRIDRSDSMVRMEVVCRHCDAHLGHVFEDGPKPTGLRFCMNSIALKLVPRNTDSTTPDSSRSPD